MFFGTRSLIYLARKRIIAPNNMARNWFIWRAMNNEAIV
jgi:hypothetical protein